MTICLKMLLSGSEITTFNSITNNQKVYVFYEARKFTKSPFRAQQRKS